MALTQVQPGMLGTPQPYNFKNRIINGAMVIDQRNAGASIATSSGTGTVYTLDRWSANYDNQNKYTIQQNAGSVTPPVGFSNYLGVTSSAATTVGAGNYYYLRQSIEGYNFADLNFGTANAKTFTFSFWVRSSLTGTFGGAFNNATGDRNYPFTYTISSANTWEQKSITVAGDTTGTWVGATNGIGISVDFGLGVGSTYSGTAGSWSSSAYYSATGATSVVGTNGATFFITGVQLEVGVTATTFDYRSIGTELALCQRYFVKIGGNFLYDCIFIGFYTDSVTFFASYPLPVTMRTTPTVTSNALYVDNGAGGGAVTALSVIANQTNPQIGYISATTTNGTLGRSANMRGNNSTSNYLSYSAEL